MSEQISQCEQCQQRFTLIRRKKQCNLCGQGFCSKCVSKSTSLISINNSPRTCVTCLLITNNRTTRDQLAAIRTKHLRAYIIHSKIVSINRLESCFEKQDLINLIESKKRQLPDDSYVFVERGNMIFRQPADNNTATNNDATTRTTNINNHQEEAQPQTPNRNEQVPTPTLPPAPVPSNTDQQSETPVDPPPPPPPPKAPPVRINLDDVSSIESIQNLTIRQLKELLVQNFVSTKGCVEKQELINKVELLYRDHQQQKEINPNINFEQSEGNICKICMDANIDCVFLDCGHLCTCIQCGKRLSECPLCRSYIIRVVRVFKS